jgi:Gluconate 2-dehydrogenase subunit 3
VDDPLESRPSRRAVVTAIGLVPLASLAPSLLVESQARAAVGSGFRFFDRHQAAVVKAAAARLVPGPNDDPVEKLLNSPGATEADVVRYIDTMLSMFTDDPPKIFAGGPWSNRHGGHIDHMAHFVPPAPRQLAAWKQRVRQLRKSYVAAIKALDAAASTKNFATATQLEQDLVLTKLNAERDLIFANTIEGMYAVPEYGGNRDTLGWKSIGWPGDAQRRGYSANEVEHSDGEDVLLVTGIVEQVLSALPTATANMHERGWLRGRHNAVREVLDD